MAISDIDPAAREAVPLLINSLCDLELIHMAVEALVQIGMQEARDAAGLFRIKERLLGIF